MYDKKVRVFMKAVLGRLVYYPMYSAHDVRNNHVTHGNLKNHVRYKPYMLEKKSPFDRSQIKPSKYLLKKFSK